MRELWAIRATWVGARARRNCPPLPTARGRPAARGPSPKATAVAETVDTSASGSRSDSKPVARLKARIQNQVSSSTTAGSSTWSAFPRHTSVASAQFSVVEL